MVTKKPTAENVTPNFDKAFFDEAYDLGKSQAESLTKSIETIMDNVMKKGMVLQDALGISDGVLENLYNQTYQLYQGGQYVDASKVFRLLILLRPEDTRFAFGLASCFHMLKEYQLGAEAYAKCSLLDPNDPLPFYHAADCYSHVDNPFAAIISLEMAIKRANKPEHAAIKKRALIFLEKLRKEASSP